jgi:MFS family permease
VAQGWLVLELTNRPFWLGAIGAAGTLPILLFSLLGGVAADRFPNRALLLGTQSAAAALALLLALLSHGGWIAIWQILAIASFLGVVNALDMPARQSFVVEIAGREDLLNAIALNSFTFNAARVAGPAVAGVIVAGAGVTACFFTNAASFLPVVIALAAMRGLPARERARRGSVSAALREGFAYLARERRYQGLIALVGAGSLLGFPGIILLPAFARDVLRTGPGGFGALMACNGAGALVAALLLARRSGRGLGGREVVGAGLVFSAVLILFATSRSTWSAAPLLALAGAGMVAQAAAANTLVQQMVPDALRGRLMSIFTLVMMGGMPLGNLAIGALAHFVGTPTAIATFGAALGAAVILIAILRREIFL